MKKFITFSISGILTLVFALDAVAVSPAGQGQQGSTKNDEKEAAIEERKAEIQDKKEENQEKRLEQAKGRAMKALDRRINSLEALKTRMTERTRIREQERAMINSLIDDSVAKLKTEREQVENAGDLETLRNQFQNADKIRVNSILIPQVRAYALTSAAYNGIDRIEKVFPKIEEVIAKLEGENKTKAEEVYSQAKTEVASAQGNIDKALAEFKKMDPTKDPTQAHANLEAGKTYLKQAREELKNSLQYLKQIRTMLQQQTRLQEQENNSNETDNETEETIETETAE